MLVEAVVMLGLESNVIWHVKTSAHTITTTANAFNIVKFIYDGTNYLGY